MTLTASYTSSSQVTFYVAPPAQYPLTTVIAPQGSGTVSPSGGSFGGSVTLTAAPNPGYKFTGFNANGVQYSTNPATIPMTGETRVTVTFANVDTPPLVLEDGALQATVLTNNQPVQVTYRFSQGNPLWLDRCTTTDANVTAQIVTPLDPSFVKINFAANASAKAPTSVPVSCHWTASLGEGGIGLPPVRVRMRNLLKDPANDGGDGGDSDTCSDYDQGAMAYTAPNTGQPVTWTYRVRNADASLVSNCHFSINSVPDNRITVTQITHPSVRDTACVASLDVTLTAAGATPGPRTSLDCQYANEGYLPWDPAYHSTALTVYDAMPHITSVQPCTTAECTVPPATISPGNQITIIGYNFGRGGTLKLCAPDGSGCTVAPYDTWSPDGTQVTASISQPQGTYAVQVESNTPQGYGFLPSGDPAAADSNLWEVDVEAGTCAVPVRFRQDGPGQDLVNYTVNNLPDVGCTSITPTNQRPDTEQILAVAR